MIIENFNRLVKEIKLTHPEARTITITVTSYTMDKVMKDIYERGIDMDFEIVDIVEGDKFSIVME